MTLTPEQIKGRLKNIAKQNKADARMLIRIFMMERFLERVANSKYADSFIIKGGILVTSMVGVAMRSTMDIDTTIRNANLSEDDALRMVNEVTSVELNDGVGFAVKEVSRIMDDAEYPGVRISLEVLMGKLVTPIKVDISTGDVITPRAIEYNYRLMLEDRSIRLWSYNLETILAEKLQTVLSRGLLNTRMRDFYDIHTLLSCYERKTDLKILREAIVATCNKRGCTEIIKDGERIIAVISGDKNIQSRWAVYQKKFVYASDIAFADVMASTEKLYAMIKD